MKNNFGHTVFDLALLYNNGAYVKICSIVKNKKINDINKKIIEENMRIMDNNTKITEENKSLRNEKNIISNDNKKLSAIIDSLQKTIAKFTSDKHNLQLHVKELTNKNEILIGKNNTLICKNEDFELANKELLKCNKRLYDDNGSTTEKNSKMQKTINTMIELNKK